MPRIGDEDIRNLARLAHLAVPEDEIPRVAAQLDRLLGYVDRLAALDVTAAGEGVHADERSAPLRPDVVVPSLPRDLALAGAPATEAGLFEVPKVLDASEGGLASRPRAAEEP